MTGCLVDVVVVGNEVTVLLVVDVVVGGRDEAGSDELDVELTVVDEASGAVDVVVDDDVPDVELVTVDVDVDVEEEPAAVLEVTVVGTELEVVLTGNVVALLVVEIEVVVDDDVVAGRVLEARVDVLVETTVLDVAGTVEGTVEVALVDVVAVPAVVAVVDCGGSVVSVVLLVVLVVVVANVSAKPPIWIRLSLGLPPKVVTKRSSPVRGSNSRPSGPTPKSDAKGPSTGDEVPRVGSPDCTSIGSPLVASMRRTRSCPSSKFA